MALYYCPKCGSFVARNVMGQHVRKCGNRTFSIFAKK